MLQVGRFFRQSRMLLRHRCRFCQQCCRFSNNHWMLPISATMSNEISPFRQSRNKFNMFNLFRLCRKDDILRSDKLVRHCCSFWQQSRMLLRQSRTLLRHCCLCWRGLRRRIYINAVSHQTVRNDNILAVRYTNLTSNLESQQTN